MLLVCWSGLVLAGLGSIAACDGNQDSTPACGDGVEIEYQSQFYCVYGEIRETGFRCPDDRPNRHDREDVTICCPNEDVREEELQAVEDEYRRRHPVEDGEEVDLDTAPDVEVTPDVESEQDGVELVDIGMEVTPELCEGLDQPECTSTPGCVAGTHMAPLSGFAVCRLSSMTTCTMMGTSAQNPETGECLWFASSCTPDGWPTPCETHCLPEGLCRLDHSCYGDICVDGSCTSESDCPSGQQCECSVDIDCQADQYCFQGQCRANECDDDCECGMTTDCDGGKCVECLATCASDPDCPEGAICEEFGNGCTQCTLENPSICGTIAGLPCDVAFYCEFANDVCGGDDSGGLCLPRPTDCEAEPQEPVCGCDREVYVNICSARAAGQDVRALGGCTVPADMFACGFLFCDLDQLCEEKRVGGGVFLNEYACKPLPEACGDSPACTCVAQEPCGAVCEQDDEGNITITCEGE